MKAFSEAFQEDKLLGLSFQIVCFEKQSDWGGMWNYTWRTGVDEYGDPVHHSMYRDLWTNGPTEAEEFIDYTLEHHFGRVVGSYLCREAMRDYITGRVMSLAPHVKDWIRFNTSVRNVVFNEETKQFTVTAYERLNDKTIEEVFDYVIVASGHYTRPNMPEFEGFSTFPGTILHSHDFRDARRFANMNVLVIGVGYSGEDISSQCWKFGAKSITISYKLKIYDFNWPKNIELRPLLTKMDGKTAHFIDGSVKEDIDAIIFCTGYVHNFPFLPDSLRIKGSSRQWCNELYKGVMFEGNHQLFYIGMFNQNTALTLFDAQGWYIRDLIVGKLPIPPSDQRKENSDKWKVEEQKVAALFESLNESPVDPDKVEAIVPTMIGFDYAYIKELVSETGCPTGDLDRYVEILLEFVAHKREDVMTFRDRTYRSPITGKMSVEHHTKWVDAKDDSLEAFLNKETNKNYK